MKKKTKLTFAKKNKKPQGRVPSVDSAKQNKITVSLALDKTVVLELRKQAEDYRMSFNSRINEILKKYITFFAMTEQDRAAIIPRSLHQFFVNEIDELKYTNELKKIGVEIIDAMFVRTGMANTLDNLIDFTFKGVCVNGGSITSVRRYVDEADGKTCLYFTHDYGTKWSRILSAAFQNHIETVLHCHTTSTLFPEGFEIKILEKGLP